MAEEGLIRPRMSNPAGHMVRRSSTASVLVVDAASNCKVFQARKTLPLIIWSPRKTFFPSVQIQISHSECPKLNKYYICFLPIIKNWIIQCIHVLRFAQTFPSHMPFFPTCSALMLNWKCTTLFVWVTRCRPTVVTPRPFLPLLWLWKNNHLAITTIKSKSPQESNKIKFIRQGLKTQYHSPFAYS